MKRILSFILIACIFVSLLPFCFADDYSKTQTGEVSVFVDGEWHSVRILRVSYDNNVYFSCRSFAEALSGSSASFDFHYRYTDADGSYFEFDTSSTYDSVDIKDPGDPGYIELRRNRMFIDGNERRYYSYRFGDPEDLYIAPIDLCFLLDINIVLLQKGAYQVLPDSSFSADVDELDRDGFFDCCSSVLSGNALSGDIYFSRNISQRLSVASTTKLLSYVLIMEAINSGKTSYDSVVTLSDNVVRMSSSENGLIEMDTDDLPTVRELMGAMLIASSNEATLALAEHIFGSEDSFVTQMNRKARSLGLSDSRFYNCTGLPFYTDSVYGIKKQSYMSTSDMFTLVSYILKTYPEITDITSRQFETFPTFEYTTANSNTLVFNMDNCNGLKTGNTKQAGCCVVATDTDSNIVIVFGAEDNALRGRVAELLFRCTG